MKFTDGYWQALPSVTILRPQSVDDVVVDGETSRSTRRRARSRPGATR
jgi:hypothetical protein